MQAMSVLLETSEERLQHMLGMTQCAPQGGSLTGGTSYYDLLSAPLRKASVSLFVFWCTWVGLVILIAHRVADS